MSLFDLLAVVGLTVGIEAGYFFNADILELNRFQSCVFLFPIFVGGYVGLKLGWVPYHLCSLWIHRQLAKMSVLELRRRIKEPTYEWPPGMLLAELRSRGEDIQQHLPLVLRKLMADDSEDRRTWWLALLDGYPELGQRVEWISSQDPGAVCRRKLKAAGLFKSVPNVVADQQIDADAITQRAGAD